MCDRQYLPYHTSIGLVPRSEVSISLQLRPPSMFTFISPQEGEDARWREELALERELEEDTLGMRALLTLRHAHAPRPSTYWPCGAGSSIYIGSPCFSSPMRDFASLTRSCGESEPAPR